MLEKGLISSLTTQLDRIQVPDKYTVGLTIVSLPVCVTYILHLSSVHRLLALGSWNRPVYNYVIVSEGINAKYRMGSCLPT